MVDLVSSVTQILSPSRVDDDACTSQPWSSMSVSDNRVVVTGLGAVTSLGNSALETWQGIRDGRVGIGSLTKFDPEPHSAKIASEVKDLNLDGYLDRREARRMDPFTVFSMVSSIQAIRDAGLENPYSFEPERVGIMLGVGFGGVQSFQRAHEKISERGPSGVEPLFVPKLMANSPVGQLAIRYGIRGPGFVISSACTSATDAIGRALRCIKSGMCDVMITGGAEALLSPITFAGFGNLQALTTAYNDHPKKASRPFDRNRSGFVLAEGSGILILESINHARQRNATIYAELTGYGATCDANHLTAPHPNGRGAQAAMRIALQNSGLVPDDVDYINAHGTSTLLNDPIETAAIKAVFGEQAYRLKVSSTKSMIGHLLGGAGGVEALATVKSLHEQFYPPTVNLEDPDPSCDLNYVAHNGVAQPMRVALSNSFGFGGHNGVLVFKKYHY